LTVIVAVKLPSTVVPVIVTLLPATRPVTWPFTETFAQVELLEVQTTLLFVALPGETE
jgi:hypothetical protein